MKILAVLQHRIPLIETLRNYSAASAKRDIIAALTVAVVAIPQSMAYAIIAGVNPVYGLYTAIVSTIIGAIFGSSNHLIAGPTNAISLLIASGMRNYMELNNAYEMLFLLTFMVGIIQILFGVIKLGKAVNYVSHAVIVGFTSGAGVLIALGQLNSLLGISINNSAQMATLEKVYYVITHLNSVNPYAVGLGVLTIVIIIVCKLIHKRIPGALISVILTTVCVAVFSLDQRGVKLTGDIPNSLPPFKMLSFSWESAQKLFSSAIAIAVIGLVEAISISKSISATSRQKIDANQEFIGQGMANAIGAFFQCFAGSGSFTRSAINFFSGASTRIAGVMSGIIVAVVLLFLAPYAKYISKPALAGVIMLIAYNMVNKKEMTKVTKISKSDAITMWFTFAATVVMPDLDWAIYAGIAISIVIYLRNTNKATIKVLLPSTSQQGRFLEREINTVKEPADILILQIEGNLYFGSADDLRDKLDGLIGKADVYIIRMKQVVTIDITALDALKQFIRNIGESGGTIIFSGVVTGLSKMLVDANMVSNVGQDNMFMCEEEVFASSMKAYERACELVKIRKNTHIEGVRRDV